MDYYVIHVKSCQNSKFDGQPYYELEIVGIDPVNKLNGVFKTYVVTTYENFRHWQEILNQKIEKHAVWFRGPVRIKSSEKHISIIDADSTPHYIDVLPISSLEKYVLHLVDLGVFDSEQKPAEFSEVGKQFFTEND